MMLATGSSAAGVSASAGGRRAAANSKPVAPQHPGSSSSVQLRSIHASKDVSARALGPQRVPLDAVITPARQEEVLEQLREHSISSVEDLQRVHHQVNGSSASATRRFLLEVVGLRDGADEAAIESLLALAIGAEPERAATLLRVEPHRALVLAALAEHGSSGTSLDRLQNELLACSSATPRYDCELEDLSVLLADLEAEGLAEVQGDLYRCTEVALEMVQEATAAVASRRSAASRSPSPQPRHGGGKVLRQASSLGAPRRGGLSPAPTRAAPALQPRTAWASSSGLSFAGAPAAVRSSAPVASKSPSYARGASSNGSAGEVDDEELRSLEELAQFERPVLDLLQNYSGLTLERLDGMLYLSNKEPKYNQGVARLQLLLEAMEAQGTVQNDGGVYRYVRRTPGPLRSSSRSPAPSYSSSSSANGNGSTRRTPGSRGSGAPRPNFSSMDDPVDLGVFEARVMEVLSKYQVGLPLERLNNMLRMTPGSPRYEATPEQLQPLLTRLVQAGKLAVDQAGSYRTASSSSLASSASAPRVSPPAVRKSTPSGSTGTKEPMGEISSYEPAVLNLLQNYAGLTLDRLDTLLVSSPKATGYRSSMGPLSQLLARLVQEGKVEDDGKGTYRYRTRSGSPAGGRASRSPQPTANRLPPTPAGSRRRPSSLPSAGSPAAPPARVLDISSYESAVLELLQNYAGLSLERLDTLLVSAGSRAPGYVSNPAALSGLLTSLQSQGRVTKDQGVYRYRTSGRTPQRARSPSPLRAPAPSSSSSTRSALPTSTSTTPSSLSLRGASPSPSAPRASAPVLPEDDWGAYESTIMTLMVNYGALPLERLHEMLQMSMVWPRYDRTPAQLASYLAALSAAGKVIADNGLYRKAGTPPPARVGQGPTYASVPTSLAASEGHVLSTLAAYPGLTLERLHNMLRLSKDGPAQDLEEDQLATLLSSLISQGKVLTENGLYKAAPGVSSRPATSAAAPAKSSSGAGSVGNRAAPAATVVRAVGPLTAEQAQVVESLGFPTQEGLAGFTPFVEVWNGRWAMLGILASIIVEVRTGSGTLEQIGIQGLPSMELFTGLSTGAGVAVLAGTAFTLARFFTDRMESREKQRYARLLGNQAQDLDQPDRFFTDELRYARMAELTNGRAAMVGFLAAIIMEALTGRGVVGQAILYMKLMGVLGEDSGF